jgi:hypothetical protein
MKAIMSLGALIGVVGILLLSGMIVGIVPSNTVKLIEGYMPVQVILELHCSWRDLPGSAI